MKIHFTGNQLIWLCLLMPGLAIAAPYAPANNPSPATVLSSNVAHQVTVPLSFEQHRPYTRLTLIGPSGHAVRALFWLDTGGGAIILSGPLAARLGLTPMGKTFKVEGNVIAATQLPKILVGGLVLQLKDANAFLVADKKSTLDRTGAEGALPLRALRRYQVVLNYPRARLRIAQPGALRPEGRQVAAHFSKPGFIAVTATVGGKPYGFLLDSGGQYCMVSQDILAKWQEQNPRWPQVAGAYGPANMMLGRVETSFTMLRIGSLQWGPFTLDNVGSVSRPSGNYEQMMSRLTGRAVVGSIGGNVLRHFRVDIDYPKGRLYLKRAAIGAEAPLDMVGITLEPSGNSYMIAGVAKREHDLRKGDQLLSINGTPIQGLNVAEIISRLAGMPGATRTLTIERDGKTFSVNAPVIRIFGAQSKQIHIK